MHKRGPETNAERSLYPAFYEFLKTNGVFKSGIFSSDMKTPFSERMINRSFNIFHVHGIILLILK